MLQSDSDVAIQKKAERLIDRQCSGAYDRWRGQSCIAAGLLFYPYLHQAQLNSNKPKKYTKMNTNDVLRDIIQALQRGQDSIEVGIKMSSTTVSLRGIRNTIVRNDIEAVQLCDPDGQEDGALSRSAVADFTLAVATLMMDGTQFTTCLYKDRPGADFVWCRKG